MTYLPEKYQVSAFSRRRTVINLLDYIELTFGIEKRALILRKFQMNESHFLDPEKKINLRFAVDLGEAIFQTQREESTLVEMGMYSAITNRASRLGTILARSRSVKDLFEMMFVDLLPQFVEENFSWRLLSFDDYGCEVEGRPNSVLRENIPEGYIRSKTGCMIRKGFIISLPFYIGLPAAGVRKLSCICQGDPSCRYRVRFPSGYH
jgi:hypothetical protein